VGKTCVIFGGSGFVGTHLARRFLSSEQFSHIHIADIQPSALEGQPGISYSATDVRNPIPANIILASPDWIFNLAAIHREPGHTHQEYFDTNLPGAENVCSYAEQVNCKNIYFTSSISVYGPTNGPTDESSPIRPTKPYGGSKYPAELIHAGWQSRGEGRRLLISRPGVLYGPGDPGNILRMIRAVKRGYFAYPGESSVFKSYGYIYGLLESIEFLMNSPYSTVTYNYVEYPTQSLGELVESVKRHLRSNALVIPLPLWLLLPIAKIIHGFSGTSGAIHPVRVKKAATPTHIIPKTLLDLGFEFSFDFAQSLQHWETIAPADFGIIDTESKTQPQKHRSIAPAGKASQAESETISQVDSLHEA